MTVLKTARKFQIINTLLSDQALLPAKNALDVSVGTGYSTTRLARAALNAKVTGIEDAYQHTANRARNNLFKRQVSSRANVISADITKMPFDSDSFDVITGSYSKQTQLFTHSRKQRQAICDEIYRLVKKDGSGSILMVNTRRQINKYAVLFSSKPELDVYIADPEMRIKFGYRAMKIIVR
ncbi:class I SAM-dependent methyltransferase [Nicoliella lavandulae]|uniref:Class I SAM-dependent methyltransferase n=1 Tax=Nicoliella lavandulae TaxID=3082954 RepID=A0ABU8SIY6_9LACO